MFSGTYQAIGKLDTQYVAFEEPKTFTFRSTGSKMGIMGTFKLSEAGSRTRVSLEAEFKPKGILKLLMPLMAPLMRKQNKDAAERLKVAVENVKV